MVISRLGQLEGQHSIGYIHPRLYNLVAESSSGAHTHTHRHVVQPNAVAACCCDSKFLYVSIK